MSQCINQDQSIKGEHHHVKSAQIHGDRKAVHLDGSSHSKMDSKIDFYWKQ